MRKYICPNCGFRYRFQTRKNGRKRSCKNCGCEQVYSSKVLFESMMRMELQKEKNRWTSKRMD